MLGINSEDHGVLLYDFDNDTGELSNFRIIPYPDSENVAQGLCFSPNSRFIYVTTAENVYQIDLMDDNDVYHIGYFRSFDEWGWPVGLGMIFGGPDCRLYVSPGSGTNYLHVILNPDEKGSECRFAERAIELPSRIPHHLPNLPQYRYLTGCDSTIVFPFIVETEELNGLMDDRSVLVYPNPATNELNIQLPDDKSGEFIVFNIFGQAIDKVNIIGNGKLNTSQYPAGIYILKDVSGQFEVKKFEVIH
ncbi:MAG: T9SS type A sorting domain-containing protein [Saprospiraceae bacterium]